MSRRCIEACLLLIVLVGSSACTQVATRMPVEGAVTKTIALPEGDPRATALFVQASEALARNDLAAAEILLQELLGKWPDYSSPWTNLGIVYAHTEREGDARIAFGKAIALQGDDCAPKVELALLARRQHQFREAEQLYKACLAVDPHFANAALNLGILYELYLGQPSEALAAYERYQAGRETPDEKVSGWIAELSRRMERQVARGEPR